jgi:glycosyltransferase involved in cell wall biosynthesis
MDSRVLKKPDIGIPSEKEDPERPAGGKPRGGKAVKAWSALFIVPYFGRWPEWIDLYWASCGENSSIHWLFFTDCAIPKDHAANLRFVSLSFEQYCDRVSARLDISFSPPDPYKLCDLKPALGYLHEQELEGYDFWGFTDVDIVYGDLRKGLPAGMLEHGVISAHADRIAGHFTLLRNTAKYKKAFMRIPQWRRILERPEYRSMDEGHFTKLFLTKPRKSIVKLLFDSLRYFPLRQDALFFEAYSTILSNRPWLDGGSVHPLTWHWNKGRLTNSRDGDREFLYLHFMNLKSARYLPKNRGAAAAWEGLSPIVHVDPMAIPASWMIDEKGFHREPPPRPPFPMGREGKGSVPVSVIVPAYNVLPFVEESVDSILTQSALPHEVIIIDDGSTDGTGDLVERLYGSRESMRIVHCPNRGLGEARNLGASLATGEFILFFDSDDRLKEHLLASFGEALRQVPDMELFCYSGTAFLDESIKGHKEISLAGYRRRLDRVYSSGEEAIIALGTIPAFYSVVWLYIVKRELLARHDMRFSSIIHEDEEFTPRLFLVAARTLVTDHSYLEHRLRAGSIMRLRTTTEHLRGLLTSIESLDAFLVSRRLKRATKGILSRLRRGKLLFVIKHVDRATRDESPGTRSRLMARIRILARKDARSHLIYLASLYRFVRRLIDEARHIRKRLRG